MSILGSLFSTALFACLLQNLIFTGAYGGDEAIRMAAKPKQLFPLSAFIVYLSTVVSLICVLLEQSARVRALNTYAHAAIFVGVLIVVYLITLLFVKVVLKVKKRTVRRLGVAAFNTLVLAVPFINYRAAYGVLEAVGTGIGAGLSFVVAVLLINFGLRAIDKNEQIPKAFKGTPAIFIYVAILSLAFTGIVGRGINL